MIAGHPGSPFAMSIVDLGPGAQRLANLITRVDDGELDVRVFEGHVAAARAAYTGRDWERTVQEASAALALWRGTPLNGLPPETGGHALVQRRSGYTSVAGNSAASFIASSISVSTICDSGTVLMTSPRTKI